MSQASEMVILLQCDSCGAKTKSGDELGWISWQEDGKEKHNCKRCQHHGIEMYEIGAG